MLCYNKNACYCNKRGSYNGSTSAFQADSAGSIPAPRSTRLRVEFFGVWLAFLLRVVIVKYLFNCDFVVVRAELNID